MRRRARFLGSGRGPPAARITHVSTPAAYMDAFGWNHTQMSANPDLPFSLGRPTVSARSADLYPWDGERVLKLFRHGFQHETAMWERRNIEEAHALGATRVACFGETEIDGRTGLILRRIEGGTLTASANANPLRILEVPEILAHLHARMHASATLRLRDVRTLVAECLGRPAMAFLAAPRRDALERQVAGLPDGTTLLHLDFHTDNVLGPRGSETVIDWATAAGGAAGADMAMTWFLFHEAELFPGISKVQELLYNTLRKFIYRRYFAHYLRLRGLSADGAMRDIRLWYLPILVFRLATWEAPTEVERLRRKIEAGADELMGAAAGSAGR